MTIEVIDALHQYYGATKESYELSSVSHTVLILDKPLHCFPWESLPCLDGHAVSRLPSLTSLRSRILSIQDLSKEADVTCRDRGLCIGRQNGAYVLNPGGDLDATQAKFEEPLKALSGWDGLVRTAPNEDQIRKYLGESEVFLYFGHGSGSQYIRPRAIKNLEKCAVALLMGCSSGRMTEAGEFEPFGTPTSYMQAGCPAMVATLWDVTDKDIDRYSTTLLEDWGLLGKPTSQTDCSPVKKPTRGKGKEQGKTTASSDNENMSLDRAVSHARGSCIFRYLNGAAPIVYGVPVFLS